VPNAWRSVAIARSAASQYPWTSTIVIGPTASVPSGWRTESSESFHAWFASPTPLAARPANSTKPSSSGSPGPVIQSTARSAAGSSASTSSTGAPHRHASASVMTNSGVASTDP
jgi:hypothetical protein